MVKEIGHSHGYSNLYAPTNLVISTTSELLLAKKKGKKYKTGDKVLTGFVGGSVMFGIDFHIYLLEKQDFGWKMLNAVFDLPFTFINPTQLKDSFNYCLSEFKITMDEVKSVLLRTEILREMEKVLEKFLGSKLLISVSQFAPDKAQRFNEYLDITGEYLSKVYAGEEYFND
uniref:Uncharacterized protein n=1 Tax=Panagrolaimus sp. JU765 TaxID=591449 RepID=A0AC34RGQ1_9BILA